MFVFINITSSAYTTTIGNCERGYCPKDYSCISNYCVKGAIQANPTTMRSPTNNVIGTTRRVISTSSCMDKLAKCPTVTNLCNNNVYKNLLREQCPKSCNFC